MKNVFVLLALAAIVNMAAAAPQPNADAVKPGATLPAGHVPIGSVPVDLENIKVSKVGGLYGKTVAEVVAKRMELKGKTVVVRGKVVKFNPEILDRNWIHLRDGTGSSADNTNDVLVTTKDQARVGDIVVAKGVVHIDRDLGMGYSYKVLIEEATLQK